MTYLCPKVHSRTVAKTWEQPNCLRGDGWAKKLSDIYKCYSTIKNNEIMPFVTIWMDLEIIILSHISQTKQRQISFNITLCGIFKKKNTNELTYKTEIDPKT